MERRLVGDQIQSFGSLASSGRKKSADYHPKRKGLAASWTSLQNRYPKTIGSFQIFLTAGFLAVLILRGVIGIGNSVAVTSDDASSKDYNEEAGLMNLDIELANDQMKLNLLQKGEEELERIRQAIKLKGKAAKKLEENSVPLLPAHSSVKDSKELLQTEEPEMKTAEKGSFYRPDVKAAIAQDKVELLTTKQAREMMTKAIRRDDPNAYTLGPRITDWDKQRAEWLENHPGMASTDPHKPRVLLLTGSQPWPCKSPIGDHYLLKMIKNKVDYARIHKIETFYNLAHLDLQMSNFWAKLPIIRKMMLIRPEVEWIFWMDSDAMFTDMVFEIPFEKYESYNLVMWGYNDGIYKDRSWVACNTGVFFLRNNQWTLDLLETWSHMGPEGQIREETGRIMSSYLTNRAGDLVADDQSALVYLMLTRPELRPKIFLEWGFWLSGYWAEIVNKYEEYSATSHPGAGGNKWPFTTHFTGCQPCNGLNNEMYKGNSCLDGMERAFNFADNQVLKSFGFEHDSLQEPTVRRIRNETSQPLVTVPVHNPWAVESFY